MKTWMGTRSKDENNPVHPQCHFLRSFLSHTFLSILLSLLNTHPYSKSPLPSSNISHLNLLSFLSVSMMSANLFSEISPYLLYCSPLSQPTPIPSPSPPLALLLSPHAHINHSCIKGIFSFIHVLYNYFCGFITSYSVAIYTMRSYRRDVL